MTARNFLCTLNLEETEVQTWTELLFFLYEKTGANYCVGQLERGEKENHPHIQFYMSFPHNARVSKITKVNKRVHVERVKVNNGADRYCMKEETRVEGPVEYGVKPIRRNNKTDWEEVWSKAKEGKLEDIPANIRVVHYNKLKQINKDNMKFEDKEHLRGIWIYGKSGSGKSRWVRENCKDLYPKLCNKWWDGYTGQKYVVMDDIDPKHNVLSQQLKIWADRYGCILETKGGAITSKYEWFIVTSQYTIDEVFTDEQDREAIHRRFQEFNIKDINKLKLTIN